MKRNVGRVLFAMAVLLPTILVAQEKSAASGQTLVVKVKYKGKGTVDDKHKIYVMVIDSDPYAAEGLADATSDKPVDPKQAEGKKVAYILQRQSASSKEQDVTFTGLKKSPVYVIAFLDQPGTYEQTSGPSSGSPSGQYGSAPGKPEPIKLKDGKPTEVKLQFDDTSKVP